MTGADATDLPHTGLRFSVIVPTRARLPELRRCLDALAAQRFPRDAFEVIVVNDGSPPLAEHELARYHERLQLRSLDQPWGGPAAARNTGIAHARAAMLAFTDDDCAPEPGWLAAFDEALAHAPLALVGGHVRNALQHDPCASASQLLVDYLYERFDHGDTLGPRFFTSNDLAGSTRLFRDLGGFDTSFRLAAGEDRDLTDRWRLAGHPLVYVPAALVLHYHAMSLGRFTRQHLNYGRGAWTFHRARRVRHAGPRRTESVGFYVDLVCYPLRQSGSARGVLHSALLIWSQVVNAFGYALEATRPSSR
jgi:GT2 family glycosyltransferase